ncbi:Uncharacterized protein Cob_v005653 [Colletotrichum orbiculare MAFF 240422]|uniref:Uncharacterized protein n=1 Tax=Colletotrichum orbiculare (strain 104-T / ATCC 96160 / CBS 514.97 / LARS 414 / MAFF 240422) TaxID=1213857 RepID=A0A484FTZ3_COLOR|nr:Uncharacterized protein Cob_v005653 [Colletotrichum orbiculare MAFF 240422]
MASGHLAGLIPQDVNPQLKGHLRGALNVGASVDEIESGEAKAGASLAPFFDSKQVLMARRQGLAIASTGEDVQILEGEMGPFIAQSLATLVTHGTDQ